MLFLFQGYLGLNLNKKLTSIIYKLAVHTGVLFFLTGCQNFGIAEFKGLLQ